MKPSDAPPHTYIDVEETPLKLVDCMDRARVTARGPIRHLCPYVDEVDEGHIEITWSTAGCTIELHSLRDYLDTFAKSPISHEAVAALVLMELEGATGIEDIEVRLEFQTAGFGCTVRAEPPG